MIYYKSNMELLKEYDTLVYGHTRAKKALLTLVNRSKRRHHQKMVMGMADEYLLKPLKVLLIGESGSGKTHLIQCLQRMVNFPLLQFDATKFSPTSASGGISEKDVQKMIWANAEEFVSRRCSDYKYAEFSSIEGTVDQTVIFVDEIDKLGLSADSTGNWNRHVQDNFLTLFDNKTAFNGVSFIFAGTFNHYLEWKNPGSACGFTNKNSSKSAKRITDEELIKAGMVSELVGRLNLITELDQFSKEDYIKILIERILPDKIRDLASMGIFNIHPSDEWIESVIKKTVKSRQGVRALQREVELHYLDEEFNSCDKHPRYTLDKPALLDNSTRDYPDNFIEDTNKCE